MKNELFPHQKDALAKLNSGSILCGDVGTGKSRTALAFYQKEFYGRNLFIITTARKRDTMEWVDDLYPFDWKLGLNESFTIVVDSWNNIEKYVKVEGAFFIFDEQRVVGSGAWVKAFLKITRRNKWILLTATPGDSWLDYIPVFIANGFYRNRTEFLSDHVVFSPFTSFPKVDRFIGTRKLTMLRNKILCRMEYKKATTRHECEILVKHDAHLYKVARDNYYNVYTNEPCKNVSEMCAVLRHITNANGDRLEQVKLILAKHKTAIIFYNFNYELEMLRTIKRTKAEWNGHKHESLPEGDEWIYLVQYSSGSEGWNCIRTDTIIFFSQTYSWKTLEQAKGRIDRLHTPFRDLYYYHIRSNSPLDLAILRSLVDKKVFNEARFLEN